MPLLIERIREHIFVDDQDLATQRICGKSATPEGLVRCVKVFDSMGDCTLSDDVDGPALLLVRPGPGACVRQQPAVFASSQLRVSVRPSDGWQKWLQELPGHLLTAELLATQRSEVPHGHRLAAVSQLIKRLPDRNRAVLQSVLEFADNVCPRTQRWSGLYH